MATKRRFYVKTKMHTHKEINKQKNIMIDDRG